MTTIEKVISISGNTPSKNPGYACETSRPNRRGRVAMNLLKGTTGGLITSIPIPSIPSSVQRRSPGGALGMGVDYG